MAARKVQLKDNSGNKAYPVTSSACVGMSDGSGSLDEKISGIISNSGYVTCTEAAGTAAKTVTQANFMLSTNCRLIVKMANYNTAASPTLNVNNTGAKPLYYNGEVASADNTWEAGEVLDVYYDGTNYQASNIQGGAGEDLNANCVNLYSGIIGYIDYNNGLPIDGIGNYCRTDLIELSEFSKLKIKVKGNINNVAISFYSDRSFYSSYLKEYTIMYNSNDTFFEIEIDPLMYENASYVCVACQSIDYGNYMPSILGYKKSSILANVLDEVRLYKDYKIVNACKDMYYCAFDLQGNYVITNTGITTDLLPVDDTLIGIEAVSLVNNNTILIAYFSDKNISSILKEDSIPMTNAYIYVPKESIPKEARYFAITCIAKENVSAHIYYNKSSQFDKTNYIDLIDLYEPLSGIIKYDGTVIENLKYGYIIVPLKYWQDFSFKIAIDYSSSDLLILPILLFLKSTNIADKIDEFCCAYIENTHNMIYGHITDDDIPKECTHIAFSLKISNINYSFIRAKKRGEFLSKNKELNYISNHPRFVTVKVNTDNIEEWPNDKTEHNASVHVVYNGTTLVQDDTATIEYQGSSTMAYPKKNFRVKFAVKHKFGDWIETKKYNLKAYYLDVTQMREVIMYHLAHLMYCAEDNISKRYPFSNLSDFPTGARGVCDLFPCELEINGEFYGLYHFGLAKDKDNLLIDEDNPLHFAFEPNVDYGMNVWTDSNGWDPVVHDDVPVDMRNKLQGLLDFLQNSTINDMINNASLYINIDSWIKYYILSQVIFNWDGLTNNMILVTYDGGNTFSIFPYDGDNTFGFMNNKRDIIDPKANLFENNYCPNWLKNIFIISFANEMRYEFRSLYDKGVFTFQTFCNLVDEYSGKIPFSIYEKNTEKWGYPGNYTDYPIHKLLKWYKERLWFLKAFFRYD